MLASAGQILMRDGLAAVTFDRVAKESGSSKMTLYKWWPSPGMLAAEAYFAQSEQALEFPDTGDLRADLTTQLTAFVRLLSDGGTGSRVAEIIGAAQMDPDLARAWKENYSAPRRELARARLHAAQQRGQLRADADLEIIVDHLWGACYHRLLVLKVPVDESLVPRLIDQTLRGVTPAGA
ncbi:TetR/AcrR family transcriptional regulator [Catenuloplanes niger JCM 9533]